MSELLISILFISKANFEDASYLPRVVTCSVTVIGLLTFVVQDNSPGFLHNVYVPNSVKPKDLNLKLRFETSEINEHGT